MTYSDLHIGDISSSRYLAAKIFILGLFSTLVIQITKRFWLRTGTFKKMAKKFEAIHQDNLAIYDELQKIEITKEQAVNGFEKSRKLLKALTTLHSQLEKDKFFGNSRLEEAVENALLSFYRAEAHFKAIATKDVICDEQDSALIQFASNISLGSLQA